ncbi:uncharacterized protein LOC126678533 [Mercurialis annua]|uniref:uncharacterized protein LOC126678533 n=1 Tax=Mercurialis annua TaxID=3986 RepID=UPI00215EF763|nr:uncharacterized protein LOC126678533 [Mercurialis annua]
MANSSKENSPSNSANPSDHAIPVTAQPPSPVPVPARSRHFGEGSSSVPVGGQELFEGFSSSSSSSSSPSPAATPPRRVVQIALGGMRRGHGEANMMKALAEKKDDNAASQVADNKRKKREMDAPKSEPICSLCGKRFASWKGVFGHLRAHPERDWRGAFPPPKGAVGTWSPIKMSGPDDHQARQVQLLAPKMLHLARETLAKMREDSTAAASGGAASSPRVTNIDLNQIPGSSSSESPPPPPQGGAGGSGSGGLDLNRSPPESDDAKNAY